jgi:hypothetical protein
MRPTKLRMQASQRPAIELYPLVQFLFDPEQSLQCRSASPYKGEGGMLERAPSFRIGFSKPRQEDGNVVP